MLTVARTQSSEQRHIQVFAGSREHIARVQQILRTAGEDLHGNEVLAADYFE